MKTPKRKTRSDKFPLTLHPTGQYCKKVKGKMYYFGSDKKAALQKYLDQAAYLPGYQTILEKPTGDNMTLKQLCDMYLNYQYSKLRANDLTASHYNEQVGSLNKLMAFLGQTTTLNTTTTKFSRLIKKSDLDAPKGTGFYTLRRTAATIAARSGDPFAVQRLLGHADLQMATRYVQDVSKQTDRVIENSRKYLI